MTKDLVKRADPGKIALLTGKQHNLIVDRAFRPSSGARMLESPVGIAHRDLKPKKPRFGKLYENLDQGSSALMDVWAGDPLAETSKRITVRDWFLETGESITSGTKVKVEFINGKWYVIDWKQSTQQARWIKFSATEDFTSGEANVTIDGITYYDGPTPDPEPISVENPGWAGLDNDVGLAFLNSDDSKYYIASMITVATDIMVGHRIDFGNNKKFETLWQQFYTRAAEVATSDWRTDHEGIDCV